MLPDGAVYSIWVGGLALQSPTAKYFLQETSNTFWSVLLTDLEIKADSVIYIWIVVPPLIHLQYLGIMYA